MRIFLFLTVLLVPALAAAQVQSFRFDHFPNGPHPYDYTPRSPTAGLAFTEARRIERKLDDLADHRSDQGANGSGDSAAGGAGAIAGVGSTIAIGNWTQIDVSLGDGSSATVANTSPQSNWGNPAATSNIDSQNASGDQVVNNGGAWKGYFADQTTNQNTSEGGCCKKDKWHWE